MMIEQHEGQRYLVSVVHHDSGEEPESAGVNRMVSVRAGNVVYQISDDGSKDAIREAVNWAMRQPYSPDPAFSVYEKATGQAAMPVIAVVVTSYAKAFSIDWDSLLTPLMKIAAMGFAYTHKAKMGHDGRLSTDPATVGETVLVIDSPPLRERNSSVVAQELAGIVRLNPFDTLDGVFLEGQAATLARMIPGVEPDDGCGASDAPGSVRH